MTVSSLPMPRSRRSGGSRRELRLNAWPYDPAVHFEQVKDKWIGLETPDGR